MDNINVRKDDVFLEKIVARRKTGKDYLKIAAVIIGALVVLFLLVLFNQVVGFLTPLLLVGAGYAFYMLLTGMSIEYEYIVTNGDLDIDQIIARRKRKRIYSCQAKDMEIIAKLDSDEWRQAQRQTGRKLLDCSAVFNSPDNWFILSEYKNQRVTVVFEPDERMLRNLRRFNPSKVKYIPH
ncbi:MAG: hypothetical protein GX276_01520 [Clostridiaceae bacterium]|nr:hypothetical protein [Clostridiaceae bacterium]